VTGRRQRSRRFGNPHPQRGVALVVALLMVLITTLLGLSLMRIGNIESRAIDNVEFDRTNLHAAESAAFHAFGSLDPGTLPPFGAAATAVDVTGSDARFEIDVTARLEGRLPVMNSSLRLFARSAYAIQSRATSAGLGARRTVVLGATQRVPIAR